jgi:hypothetical protein
MRRGVWGLGIGFGLALGVQGVRAEGLVASLEPSAPRPLAWERIGNVLDPAPAAVAAGGNGALILGGSRGLLRFEGAIPRSLRSGPVHDLARAPDGAIFVATSEGVWRLDAGGRLQAEAWGVGGELRGALRLAAAAGRVAAATPEGVRLRDSEGRWRRLGRLPSRAISFVALRDRGAEVELWLGAEGELWIAGLDATPQSAVTFAQRIPIPGTAESRSWRAAAFACGEADVLLLASDGLWFRDAAARWHDARPVWPPGATALRLACTKNEIVVATDAGLLVASAPRGPWRRAAAPLGSLPALALTHHGDALFVVNRRGLWRSHGPSAPPVQLALAPPPGEPSIAQLQRAARRHLGLEATSIHALRTRASQRGLWPELDLRVGYDRDRDSQHDADQSFVAGETRFLKDVTHDRGDRWSAEVSLSWDLGDAAFDPEEIDAAREARAWIGLRDDVLDEVNQLYFERRRALAQQAALPAGDPEHVALGLRAQELAAGLDAWTGGVFSRRPHDPVPSTPLDKE